MSIIKLENVTKIYKTGNYEIKALDDVSLEIEKGEMIAIMGPSGSGKSTLLHLIGCLDKPTSGNVYVFGKNTKNLSDKELAEIRNLKIGFIFQQFYLLPHKNVFENVELPLIISGKPKKYREKRVKELLKLLEMDEFIYNRPNKLSGGQQQRVAIARALANDPEIILADEPTGNLDIKSTQIVIDTLKKLNEDLKKTIIIATHDIKIAEAAKRIIVIRSGKILGDGVNLDQAIKILKK
ncbi:MAG: ABC transporter ATP-binding protein [Nanopusillaceae archaeon]